MRQRLDKIMVARGLAASRERAHALILAGEVWVNDLPAPKPGMQLLPDARIRLAGEELPWVSRGALKLLHALEQWSIRPDGWVCLDVGASTGGFTEVLLTHGAARVYAVDVGYGQLAWKLQQDPRVVSIERSNIRHLEPERIPEPVDFLTMDVSFISLTVALPPALSFLRAGGSGVVLIKPQFEVGRGEVGKGGVVRDPLQHEAAVEKIRLLTQTLGLEARGVLPSPITGPKGNREFLFHFAKPAHP